MNLSSLMLSSLHSGTGRQSDDPHPLSAPSTYIDTQALARHMLSLQDSKPFIVPPSLSQQPKISDGLWPKQRSPIHSTTAPTTELLPSINLALRLPVAPPAGPYLPVPTRPGQALDSSRAPIMQAETDLNQLKRLASENKEMRTPKPYTGRKRGRKKIDKSSFFCHNCGSRATTEWRKGPNGKNTLCNACGLRYRKDCEKEAIRIHSKIGMHNLVNASDAPPV